MTPNIGDLTAQIQSLVGATIDRKYGLETAQRILVRLNGTLNVDPQFQSGERVDERSEKAIATLQKEVQPYARALLLLAKEHGVTLIVTSALRTFEEQEDLYKQGRSLPGKIVTNAHGGYSNHNFGIAFDVTIFQGQTPIWDSPIYKAVGAWGTSLGLFWGGNWTSPEDQPHFELHPTWSAGFNEVAFVNALRQRKENGQSFFV